MKNFILSVILILSAIQLNAQSITFKVAAPPTVAAGTRFNLTYVINSARIVDFRLPVEVSEHFSILSGPNLSQTQEAGWDSSGKMVSVANTTYTTVLLATKEGEFKFSPATVKIGNSEYKSDPVTVKVLPPDKQAAQSGQQQGGGAQQRQGGSTASNDNVFYRMIVSNNNVYEQEGFLVTFKLYTTLNIEGLGRHKFPEFDDFLALQIDQNSNAHQKLEQINGVNFQTFELMQYVLFPVRSGQLKINNAELVVNILQRRQSSGNSIHDFFSNPYQIVQKELITSPATVNVKPLPAAGKPASFSNAVGNFTMNADINKTELKANEAVTVKVVIKGNGNIKLVKHPEVVFPNDFEVLDPVITNDMKVSTTGASGTKTIEYTAIPRYAGDFEIPAITFSYFDTKSETYKTITKEAIKLHVEKGEGGSEAPVVSSFTNRENVKLLGKDIRYIKTNNVTFISNKEIFFGSFLHVMAYLMITVLFIVFFVIYRKQVQENSNIALVRTKKANKTAVKRLKQAEILLKENKEELFYEEVSRALWGYLSDKLNIPQSTLTKENVSNELAKYGVDEALTAEFLEIINTCEFARYAPNKTSGAMDKLFSETIDAIGKMENTIKK